jgi:hypothetical protein
MKHRDEVKSSSSRRVRLCMALVFTAFAGIAAGGLGVGGALKESTSVTTDLEKLTRLRRTGWYRLGASGCDSTM